MSGRFFGIMDSSYLWEVFTMDLDINKIKDMAEDAVDKVSKDQSTKAAVDKAIGEVEKKVKVDLPDVDSIAKTLGSDKKHS